LSRRDLGGLEGGTRIVAVEGLMSGDPTVEGTRVRPESVLVELAAGTSRMEMFRHYPSLPHDAIEASIAWDKAGRPR
jgi:uncharacterized protein (DUF433 family)